MNHPDESRRRLFEHAIQLQGAINDGAAEYFRTMDAQRERFRNLETMINELAQSRALLAAAGSAGPDLLTEDAEKIAEALKRHGCCGALAIPPGDVSAN
jgi:hypothetical protein